MHPEDIYWSPAAHGGDPEVWKGRIQSRFRCSVDNFTGMKLNLHICIKLTVWTTYCIFIVADIKEAMLTVTEPSTDPGGYRPPCHIRPL